MNRKVLYIGILIGAAVLVGALALQFSPVTANVASQADSVPRGGALYDKWYAVLGQEPPAGNMPLWETQTSNTRSGPDTWRCVTCHGWDYQGKAGAYRSGANFTSFPGLYPAVQEKSPAEIVAALSGQANPQHNFSPYLDETSLNDLATFLKEATIDDNEFIDPVTLKVKDGDPAHGKQLYDESCAECHGQDGKTITFRFEGVNAYLGTLGVLDPWRFLHKTRFGTPGTPMPIGYDLGWTPQDGRDVLLYAQSLPSGQAPAPGPVMEDVRATPAPNIGGPAGNFFTGILTALGAMVAGLGINILAFVGLAGLIFLIVWILRARK